MTKTTIAFLFAASMLFTTACDPAEDPTTERAAQIDSEIDSEPESEDHDGKRGEHGKFAAQKLCSDLECSEAQVAKITELFAGKHERRDDGDREAHKAARAEANKLLAAAFRADVFDPAVLERAKPEHDKAGDHEARMLDVATQLHAILTPAQRAKLADQVEAGGPMFFMGKRGPGKRGPDGEGPEHHGPRGEGPDGVDGPHGEPGDRVAQHVSRLCEQVTCTPEQQASLTQTLTAAHEARRGEHEQRPEPDFAAVAALLRADTLDTAKLREVMDAGKAEHQARKAEHAKAFGEVVASVHAILTPEQRAIVAGAIEQDGLHALMGGKGGKRGKGGKHGKRGEQSVRG